MDIKDILEKIALPARSNKDGFYETDKLNAIENLVTEEGSPYRIVKKTEHAWIFGQKEPQNGDFPMLVSSHADIVPYIKNPFSTLKEDEPYFHGTYDNLGTNGAAVSMMVNRTMPENVYFAFTAEEETGRCTGAETALKYLRDETGVDPVCVALDVTDEGYDENRLCTVEGFNAKTEDIRKSILKRLLSGEGTEQSFEVVRLHKKDDVSILPKEYVNKNTTVFDESIFYAGKNCNSFSLCMPTEGEMHSDSGLYVKEPVLRGYELSLAQVVYLLTNTNRELVEQIKGEKDALVLQAKEIAPRKRPALRSWTHDDPDYSSYSYSSYSYHSPSGYSHSSYAMDDYEDDDDDLGYMYDGYDVSLTITSETEWYDFGWYMEEYEDLLPDLINAAFSFDSDDVDGYVQEMESTYFEDMIITEKKPEKKSFLAHIKAVVGKPEVSKEESSRHYKGNCYIQYKNKLDEFLCGVFEVVNDWRKTHNALSPDYIDQVIDEAWVMAEGYDKNDEDVFVSDVCFMYGIDPGNRDIVGTLHAIFAEEKETEREDMDDYD